MGRCSMMFGPATQCCDDERHGTGVKAIRWHRRFDVRVDDVEPAGRPGPGYVQIRVASCGICGTDVAEYDHGPLFIPVGAPHPLTGRTAPVTLGHEVCGQVIAAGDPTAEHLVGHLVAIDGLITCGACWACRAHRVNMCEQLASIGFSADGGLAAVLNAPARGCLPLADNIKPDIGALAEPLSVGVRALRRGRFQAGERVVVVGGGAVGQLSAQAALALGATEVVVVEADAARRAAASMVGLPIVVDPSVASEAGGDLVIECSGTGEGVSTSLMAARPTGRVVLVGITPSPPLLPALELVRYEQEIIGSLSHIYDEDFATAVGLINSGHLGTSPRSLFATLDEALTYLTGSAAPPPGVVKVIVHPDATYSRALA